MQAISRGELQSIIHPSFPPQHFDWAYEKRLTVTFSSLINTTIWQQFHSSALGVVQARIAHMPSNTIQQTLDEPGAISPNCQVIKSECNRENIQYPGKSNDDREHSEERGDMNAGQSVDCNAFVANAAVYGDFYQWHVDADPLDFPPSKWVNTFGNYVNGVCIKNLILLSRILLYAWHMYTLKLFLFAQDAIHIQCAIHCLLISIPYT